MIQSLYSRSLSRISLKQRWTKTGFDFRLCSLCISCIIVWCIMCIGWIYIHTCIRVDMLYILPVVPLIRPRIIGYTCILAIYNVHDRGAKGFAL